MTGASCPRCDAPAGGGAARCAACGYGFVDDAAPGSRRRLRSAEGPSAGGRTLLAAGAVAAVVVVAGAAGVAALGGAEERERAPRPPDRLQVVSERPLSTPAAERLLESRYNPLRDDDSAAVSCSGREAKPAHSVRRCLVRYASGGERRVVLLTNARGNEVLSRP